MCGIFGILSSSSPVDPDPSPRAEGFFRELTDLLRFRPALAAASSAKEAQAALSGTLGKSLELVGLRGFLAVLAQPALRERLRAALAAVGDWVAELEAEAGGGGLRDQRSGELINSLITGGRDLAWRIDRDVLKSIDAVLRLTGGQEDAPPAVLAHAWKLNLVLNSIDRLEVRGRDSAGLAVYARFPAAQAAAAFIEAARAPLAAEIRERATVRCFAHRALVFPDSSPETLLFAFKVAEEVGEMGSNVRFLREAIARDLLFQAVLREPGVDIQVLAHTRWASNGVISLANCHPVDSAIARRPEGGAAGGAAGPLPGSRGRLVAVLNGDVDNYQELYRRYIGEEGLEIDPEITTDAKIIPVVIGHHYRRTGRLEEAFQAAFDEFEGSMAIGVMAADRPGEFLFGQKGGGQGLFIGFAGDCVAIASEMYGVVELTGSYVKAEGERVPGGEVFRISRRDGAVETRLLGRQGECEVPAGRIRTAEITTRDINRGEFPRFLLKEISESVESVRKTLRGKFELDAGGVPRFFLGPEVLAPDLMARLRQGAIRRIIGIGQGTAAIAAEGVAFLLRRALAGARHRLEISAMKATELSGHHLRDDMSDTLVVAVSQSGTTTDTNRTVDLLKERGAWVIAIVNRRNSDLVYKSHGVLYTSDGRDIEMSVASTKAFYAQNVAGQVLALALAEALEALSREDLAREAAALEELPLAMEETLLLSPAVRELAERHAPRKIYWAVVGSGSGKIAADEIRIKLSELCYKSIASDFLEDKKHIDLSAEPLVLVAASGASPGTISDCVKEVSIFKAHRSVPIVIADAGERRFDPYAAGVIPVPRHEGALGYLLATMVGHLFGYHAAATFDRHADLLRSIRSGLVRELDGAEGARPEGAPPGPDLADLPESLVMEIARFRDLLAGGCLDSGLRTGTAVRLSTLFDCILGRLSLDQFLRQAGTPETTGGAGDAIVLALTRAIDELARPIDAIKHQAKTVTVGISRLEEPRADGAIWSLVKGLGLPVEALTASHRAFLAAFEPLLEGVEGATLYRVAGLDPVGRPRQGSTIRTEAKVGCAAGIPSRSEEERPLAGTKWGVVKTRDVYLGYGETDGRKVLIVPFLGERSEGRLLLLHIALAPAGARTARLRALAAHGTLLDRIKIAVTERNCAWDPALIDDVDNETLFLRPAEEAAQEIASRGAAARA